jgi:amidohydrolase
MYADLTLASASLVSLRRELHRRPELRFLEYGTARVLAARLRAAGFEVTEGIAGTGLTASIGGREPGPHVVLRADMDAVPTPDLTGRAYASEVPGIAHACGHDVHMAVVIGAGEQLATEGVPGRLTLLFQPAEEIPFGEASGARAMLDAGVLEDGIDAILGLHCWPGLPAGTVGLDDGVAMAAKDAFRIRILGSAAHAATPSSGTDAILAASNLVVSLHHLVGREVDPDERVAINVGTIRGGASQSIIPAEAEITGTVRTVNLATRARIRSSVERVAAAAAALVGARAEVEWANEMPPVINDHDLVAMARRVLPDSLGVHGLRPLYGPPMTSDDFALYAERVPGLYLKLGVAEPGAATWPSLHDGRFDVDERAIDVGVTALVTLARNLLANRNPEVTGR